MGSPNQSTRLRNPIVTLYEPYVTLIEPRKHPVANQQKPDKGSKPTKNLIRAVGSSRKFCKSA